MTLEHNRDLIILGGGRLLNAVIGLLTVRLVTTYLDPAQYGQLSLLMVIQAFCGLFLVNPIGMYINRNTHGWWKEGILQIHLEAYKWYVLLVSFVGGLAGILVFWDNIFIQIVLAAASVIVMIVGITWNSTWIPLLNMFGKRISSASWALITTILSLVISIQICTVYPSGLAWFLGQAVGAVLAAIGARYAFQRIEAPKQKRIHVSINFLEVYKFCIPLAVGTGFMWAQQSGYRLLIERYWGLASLGYLSVGLMLAGQIWGLIESLAQQFLYPFFYKRIADTDVSSQSEPFSDLINVLLPIYIVLLGAFYFAAPYLLKLLVSSKYSESGIILRIGVGIECCRVLANLLSNAAHVTKKTISIVLPYSIGAAIVLCSVPIVGGMGLDIIWAIVSLFAAALSVLIFMIIVMSNQIKFSINLKPLLYSVALMTFFAFASFRFTKPSDWVDLIVVLSSVLLICCGAIYFIIKNNASLKRLLSVNLSDKGDL